MNNSFNNWVDKLCYGSIYSHIRNKDASNPTPDKFAVNKGRQYLIIAILMYLNTPIFVLNALKVIGNNFWLIYFIATIVVIFPLGFGILNNKRMARICEKYTTEEANHAYQASKQWFTFYHIGVACFFISLAMKLIL